MNRFPYTPLAGHNIDALADHLGVTPRTIYRWKHTGLTLHQADRAAIAIGTHPALLWPNHWWTTHNQPTNAPADPEPVGAVR